MNEKQAKEIVKEHRDKFLLQNLMQVLEAYKMDKDSPDYCTRQAIVYLCEFLRLKKDRFQKEGDLVMRLTYEINNGVTITNAGLFYEDTPTRPYKPKNKTKKAKSKK